MVNKSLFVAILSILMIVGLIYLTINFFMYGSVLDVINRSGTVVTKLYVHIDDKLIINRDILKNNEKVSTYFTFRLKENEESGKFSLKANINSKYLRMDNIDYVVPGDIIIGEHQIFILKDGKLSLSAHGKNKEK